MDAIHAMAAREHQADLLRAADEWRRTGIGRRERGGDGSPSATVALRPAHADETYVVRRLAAMDDAPELRGQTLLAIFDGEAVAALSLEDGRVVANPFVPTHDAVALLRVRAGHLGGDRRTRRWRWPSLRPRFV